MGAQQPGVGQTPSSLPLTAPIRERGTSVTPAFEGWYYDKDGSQRVMVGYFNRNTKQEFDIPAGPNNRIEPGPADQGQPTHFNAGRAVGRVHDQAAEGLRHQEAELDDRRQRLHQHDHPPHDARLHRRAVRGRGEQEHAAEAQVRAERPDRSPGPPSGNRREVHRHGRRAGAADRVDLGRGREDQRAGAARGRGRGARGAERGGAAGAAGATGAARVAARRAVRPRKASRRRRRWRSPGRSSVGPAT